VRLFGRILIILMVTALAAYLWIYGDSWGRLILGLSKALKGFT